MDQFNEIHYFPIPSQGNIYTLTELKLSSGCIKLLVASLKREIFCIEYLESLSGTLISTSKEVSFTYIPSGAEIISIDAFNKSRNYNEFVIGITIIKSSNELDTLETFLNIYSGLEESDDFNIDNIAQNCLNVELNFIPYKLLHTYLLTWNADKIENKEVVFILSGSDNLVHVYREQSTDHAYKEIDNKEFFPEFSKTTSPVIWIDVYYTDDYSERVTTFCCECGYVKFAKVCVKTNKLVYNFSTRFDNYVSRVHLYSEASHMPDTLKQETFSNLPQERKQNKSVLNLLVINTVLPAVFFCDVLTFGLSRYFTLPRDDPSCILSCCEIADIDFDGKNEILIGNSTEELMLLKDHGEKGWILEGLKKLSSPVITMKYVDITGDGVKELVVFTMKGVHILQHDLTLVQNILSRKINALTGR